MKIMRNVWGLLFVITGVFIFFASTYGATVPTVLNYQGTLTDSSGTPLIGSQNITFRLHTEAASAVENAFWFETQNVVLDDSGRFSVTLGADSGNPINKDDFDGQTYIGIQIGPDLELMPRQQLTSVAYAVKAGDGVPTGAIMEFAGNTAPYGWMLCKGQEVSRTTYANLFSVIGTTYGAGDGTTTFNLPNTQGKTVFGASDIDSTFNLASNGGSKTKNMQHNHTMPKHQHKMGIGHDSNDAYFRGDSVGNPVYGSVVSTGKRGVVGYNSTGIYAYREALTENIDPGDTNSSSSSTQDVLNPFITFNYIIKI